MYGSSVSGEGGFTHKCTLVDSQHILDEGVQGKVAALHTGSSVDYRNLASPNWVI